VSTAPNPSAPSDRHTFERLVRPLTAQLNPDAQKAHGLTMRDLVGADGWPVVATDLLRWLAKECAESHPGGCIPVFIGHNIAR